MPISRTADRFVAATVGWAIVGAGCGNTEEVSNGTEFVSPARSAIVAQGATFTTIKSDARAFHQAVELDDGRVMVIGGRDDSNQPLQSTGIFDPATGSWSEGAPLAVAREWHTATLLDDGSVLVVGGYGANRVALSSVERWVNGKWVLDTPMRVARAEHSATLLPNGSVVVIGGGSLEPETWTPGVLEDTWTPGTAASTSRFGHTASLVFGKILVVGGAPTPNTLSLGAALRTAETYDPTGSGTWYPAGDAGDAQLGHSATVLATGGGQSQVFVVSGRGHAQIYDLFSNSWQDTAQPSRQDRILHASVHLAQSSGGEQIVVIGGFSAKIGNPTSEIYDVATDSWATLPRSLNVGRCAHRATAIPKANQLLVTGGKPPLSVALNTSEATRIAALGGECAADEDCLSLHCSSDGICCRTDCSGTCQVCKASNGAPADGTCALRQQNVVCKQAPGSCWADAQCDGIGKDCPRAIQLDDKTPCDDLDDQTTGDQCHAGQCVGKPVGGATGGAAAVASVVSTSDESKPPLACSVHAATGPNPLALLGLAGLGTCMRLVRRMSPCACRRKPAVKGSKS